MPKEDIHSLYGIKNEIRFNCRADKKHKRILDVGATNINCPKEIYSTACAMVGVQHIKSREDAMRVIKKTMGLSSMEDILLYIKGTKGGSN